jgi:alpha-tubulin suppressor-like RCC1 family protein
MVNVLALAAGQDHTCALRAGSGIFCWGSNAFGQLGSNAANEPTPVAVQVTGIATPSTVSSSQGVVAIAAGPHHSCAIRVDGAGGNVFCWGKNDVGQLGSGTANSQGFPAHPAPVQVGGLSDATAIAGGGGQLPNAPAVDLDFTCARRAGGTVRCWGNNDIGQLGDNSTTDRLQPQTSVVFRSVTRIGTSVITLFPALTRVAAITAASSSSPVACALLANGQPFCWGSDSVGLLGDGTATVTSRPFAAAVPSFAFNVDPAVTLRSRGRGLIVTALVDCPADATVDIQITLSQGAASGQGHAVETCPGGLTRFPITVHAHGRHAFGPGAAVAEAEALVRDGGRVIDTQQWTRAVQVAAP